MNDFTKNIAEYLENLKKTVDSLNKNEINQFINLLLDARDNDRQIFVMGNGGSGATASHFCGDIAKGASFGYEKRFRIISLDDNMPTILAYANDVGYDCVFAEQLKNFCRPADIVIGISGSGNSKNILNAMEYAKSVGAISVGITGYDGGKLKQVCDYSVNAGVNDMQISEDIHSVLCHLTMKIICDTMK